MPPIKQQPPLRPASRPIHRQASQPLPAGGEPKHADRIAPSSKPASGSIDGRQQRY